MIDDPDTTAGELIAALVEHCPEDQQEDLHHALREISEDRRGPRRWARDRLELRRYSKDARHRSHYRRMGRDFGPENLTEPGPSRSIEEFRDANDARPVRRAMDSSKMAFDQRFPGAARITRW